MVMDHKHIDELDIVERYLTGKLAVEETAEFEEHFVDCLACVDRLETTRAFIDGLRRVASETPATVAYIPNGVFWNLRYTKAFAVAAGVLLPVVVAGAVVLFSQIRRYRVEADQARSASSEWEHRYEEERQSSAATSKDHQESERELTEQVAQLRTELEIGKEQAPASKAEVNVPLLILSSTRGSGQSPDSINQVTIPRSAASVVLSLPLEGERGYKTYRMTILSSQKQVIWKDRRNAPNHQNALLVRFPSNLFRSGEYSLTLDGVAANGSTSVVGNYSFRVRKTP